MSTSLRVAACHASPVFLSARDTTNKAISLIQTAARNKANLVVFPESFIPAFPVWSAVRSPAENHDLFRRMALESVYADGDEMASIRAAARDAGVMVSVGISEKARSSIATLYNSNLIIGSRGDVLVHHRKLAPTFFEKLTWAPGDGHGLRVADTPHGRIGNLICGENTNPLAKYALAAQGEQVHISTWPAIWPTRLAAEAAGGANGANYDNVTANRVRAAAHCFEAKAFGVLCSAFFEQGARDAVVRGSTSPQLVQKSLDQSQQGATMFLDPTGAPLAGWTVDAVTGERQARDFLQAEEGILYADMNLDDCIEGKQYHDIVGGYQRLDVFDVKVDRTRREPVKFVEVDQAASAGGAEIAE
ncbi:hypothetical protein ACO1O0_007758 [Amphichorda felina]